MIHISLPLAIILTRVIVLLRTSNHTTIPTQWLLKYQPVFQPHREQNTITE